MKAEKNGKNEKLAALNSLYAAAISAGLCYDRKSFAELIGKDTSTVSKAFNGYDSFLSHKFILNAEKILQEKGVVVAGDNNTTGSTVQAAGDNTGKLLDEMKAQRELFAAQLTTKDEQIKSLMALLSRK